MMAFEHQAEPAVSGRSALQVHRLMAALMASSSSAASVALTA